MTGLFPSPAEERTTPSDLIELAHHRQFSMYPADRTNVNGTPLARTAASPRACHCPVPMFFCGTVIDDIFTRCFTPAAFAALADTSSRAARSSTELTSKKASTPESAAVIDVAFEKSPAKISTRSP